MMTEVLDTGIAEIWSTEVMVAWTDQTVSPCFDPTHACADSTSAIVSIPLQPLDSDVYSAGHKPGYGADCGMRLQADFSNNLSQHSSMGANRYLEEYPRANRENPLFFDFYPETHIRMYVQVRTV